MRQSDEGKEGHKYGPCSWQLAEASKTTRRAQERRTTALVRVAVVGVVAFVAVFVAVVGVFAVVVVAIAVVVAVQPRASAGVSPLSAVAASAVQPPRDSLD